MNALVKKEIRLLLPSWAAALMLAIASPWLSLWSGNLVSISLLLLWPGTILLAVSAFGREFSLGTFSRLLAQPSSRARIWWAKVSVLAFALLTVFSLFISNVWGAAVPGVCYWQMLLLCGVFVLMAYSGGLWTTLLFHQVAAAFWIALVVPLALLGTVELSLSQDDSINGVAITAFVVLGLYVIAGFFGARHLFLRAQDVAWTGGTVSLPVWRFPRTESPAFSQRQRHKPIAALFWKELQLHYVTLACAAALLALHTVCIFMRMSKHVSPAVIVTLDSFWLFWLIMPVLIGCTAIAEERRLGVEEGQLCLPVSDRRQFTVKCSLALVLSLLLGGVLPCAIESCGIAMGSPNSMFSDFLRPFPFPTSCLWMIPCSFGLAVVAIYASTLARDVLQAMAVFAGAIVACAAFIAFISTPQTVLGVTLWHYVLADIIGIPAIVVALLWLAYRNFKEFQESRRLWHRNLLGLTSTLVFVVVVSAALYNRIWDNFTPLEPRHGPVRLTRSNPPVLRLNHGIVIFKYNLLTVLLPNGRFWLDEVEDEFGPPRLPSRSILRALLHAPPGGLTLPGSLGPNQFIDGSNWMEVTTDPWEVRAKDGSLQEFAETIGIRSDGSLWVSEKMKEAPSTIPQLTRFGGETNWQAVVAGGWPVSAVLLKKDGTLWRWGTNGWVEGVSDWLGLGAFKPYRLGTNSDWAQIFSLDAIYARKTDGTAWTITSDGFVRATNLDQNQWRSLACSFWRRYLLGIRNDGTLWIYRENEWLQVGRGTDWTAVAASDDKIVTLKSDGSLWQWKLDLDKKLTLTANTAPTRLGIHNDWVAVADDRYGVISLAADGSLWYWPDKGVLEGSQNELWLKPSPKPQWLANIFGKSD
jgi:hypothetical protein